MKTKSITTTLGRLACLSVLTLTSASLLAEDVFITGWKGLQSSGDQNPAPLQMIDAGFAPSGAGNASAAQVSPTPVIPNKERRIHYGRAPGATWTATPTDVSVTPLNPAGKGPYQFRALQNIGVYKIYLTKGQDLNASTNIIVQMTATGGDLADANGVGSSAVLLDMFQRGKTNHVWVHVGYLTNNTLSPTITLQHVSGEINDSDTANFNGQRWYLDAIRFEYLDQCSGVATEVGVNGPLVQGQQFVNLTGIVAGATNVTVYANNNLIAETNYPAGFAGGNLTVAVNSPLVKGTFISAGQIKNGCVSTVPTSGPTVGSGGNATLRASLSLLKNSAFTGPVGANTPNISGSVNYFLKAGTFVSGFGTAPAGGEDIPPSSCWKTVSFFQGNDVAVTSNGQFFEGNPDPFCALDGLLLSIVEDETGPYDLYVDYIMNGDVLIEDFEGLPAGTSHLFAAPKNATAPNPASTYVSDPNFSVVTSSNAFSGTNSLRVQWQWTDGNNIRWARIPANMTSSSKFYPQLDPSKPITIRYLLLPSGESTNKMSFTSVPLSQTKSVGSSVTLSVTPRGEGPFTYQWQYQGFDISGETAATLTKSNLQLSDSGVYSVVVNNSTGCSATVSAQVTVSEVIEPPTLSYTVGNGKITFTWNGSFTLESRTAVESGTWGTASTSSGYEEPLNSATTKFFRLRQ